jgi:dephospho-CoA kinase
MKIIGITGTLGAGKGTIVEFLVQKKNFTHYSVRDFLLREVKKRALPENRDSLTTVANDLRKNHSPSYIVDQLYGVAKKNRKNAIIESIRTPGEVVSLRNKGDFILLAIDANPEVRFERILLRKSITDKIDFKTFLANEKREMSSQDPNKQNLGRCIQMADYVIDNNGDLDALYATLERLWENILKNK